MRSESRTASSRPATVRLIPRMTSGDAGADCPVCSGGRSIATACAPFLLTMVASPLVSREPDDDGIVRIGAQDEEIAEAAYVFFGQSADLATSSGDSASDLEKHSEKYSQGLRHVPCSTFHACQTM